MRRILTLSLLCLLGVSRAQAADDLFDQFTAGWRRHWHERSYFTRPTLYTVVMDENGQPVLHARSSSAHAGLARSVDLGTPPRTFLGWRWKVRSALPCPHPERTRAGDDFAARVCVVFETSLWPLQTRAINYVWASREPVGAVYPNPYSGNVGMFVLRSGDADAGQWQVERRDVLADYRRFFGRAATRISAVAVLVDTDNTGGEAEAWFASLAFEPFR